MVYEHVRSRSKPASSISANESSKTSLDPCAYRVAIDHPATANSAATKLGLAAATQDRPSIAVLPFQNISGDPEQD
jgi:hypothetical protein